MRLEGVLPGYLGLNIPFQYSVLQSWRARFSIWRIALIFTCGRCGRWYASPLGSGG